MFDFFTTAWEWLVAVSGGNSDIFSIIKTIFQLFVYFAMLGLIWM